jgi:hypothetical protein
MDDGVTLKHACEQRFLACTVPELKPFLKARGMKTNGKNRSWPDTKNVSKLQSPKNFPLLWKF